VREITPRVTALLIDIDVRAALVAFNLHFKKIFPQLATKAVTYAVLALKLWTRRYIIMSLCLVSCGSTGFGLSHLVSLRLYFTMTIS
jgi:hypothetical protein